MARAGAALCALVLVAVGAAGCGEEEGVAEGAVVNAYAEESVCGKAGAFSAVIQTEDGEDLKLRVVCLPDPRGPQLSQGVGGRQIDLATVGANARRATEDSRTVAFLEAPDPGVNRFTHRILEMAGIGWITTTRTGLGAVQQLSDMLATADSTDLRADVREALGQG